MLARHMAGEIDSWDTVWAYAHSTHDAVALLPSSSKVYNIGLDGSGTHCRQAAFVQTDLARNSNSDYRFPDRVEFDPHLVAEIQRVCHRSVARRAASYLSSKLRLKVTTTNSKAGAKDERVAIDGNSTRRGRVVDQDTSN
jgi:hypothetical protein